MNPEIQIKQKSDAWDMSDLHRGLRCQFSVNEGVTNGNGLSCGYLLDPGVELPLRSHKKQAI